MTPRTFQADTPLQAGLDTLPLMADEPVWVIELVLLPGMPNHVAVNLCAGEVRCIQRVAGRHGKCADEGAVFIHEIPAAAVDCEVPADLLRERRGIARERLV